MEIYNVTVTYLASEDATGTSTATFKVSAANQNDAWLLAVSKAWTLLSGGPGKITLIIVGLPVSNE